MNEEIVNGREYDFVVFGATGYTGQFVSEELYRLQTEDGRALKWAAAGRSQSKLEACLTSKHPPASLCSNTYEVLYGLISTVESGIEGIDTVVADVSDQTSLEAMCSKAAVLINCVGPVRLNVQSLIYDFYGLGGERVKGRPKLWGQLILPCSAHS